MIREPSHRAPAVLGRDDPLRLSDRGLRFLLMGIVIMLAGAILALALTPAARAAGNATKRFTDQFTNLAPGDLLFPRFPERSTIYARDGSVLATLYLDENRKVVRLDEIAPILRDAVIAIEDDGFFEHGALDVEGIVRAAFANLKAGEVTEGGSTITQQLVKTIFTSGERTFARKLEEARLAFRLEKEYSKDEILELYLNEVYMGRSVNGVQAASEFYFAKDAAQLDLSEAALLAGLIAAPEAFNPITEPEAALERRNLVLNRMRALGVITDAEAEEAKASPIVLSDKERTTNRPGKAAYFVEYIRNAILSDPTFGRTLALRKHALYQGGLRIHTTLDPKWLGYAKDAVKGVLPLPEDPQSAVVTVDSTNGAIRTLLGGTDFQAQKFDLATQGKRQPGSAFKAFTLVAALEQGVPRGKVYNMKSPATITNSVCSGPDGLWQPHNAEGGSEDRFINMDEATSHSVNMYFAQLISDIDPRAGEARSPSGWASCTELDPGLLADPRRRGGDPPGHGLGVRDARQRRPVLRAVRGRQGPRSRWRGGLQAPRGVQAGDGPADRGHGLGAAPGGGDGRNRPPAPSTCAGRWPERPGPPTSHSDGWFVGYTYQQLSTAVWVGDIRRATPSRAAGSIVGLAVRREHARVRSGTIHAPGHRGHAGHALPAGRRRSPRPRSPTWSGCPRPRRSTSWARRTSPPRSVEKPSTEPPAPCSGRPPAGGRLGHCRVEGHDLGLERQDAEAGRIPTSSANASDTARGKLDAAGFEVGVSTSTWTSRPGRHRARPGAAGRLQGAGGLGRPDRGRPLRDPVQPAAEPRPRAGTAHRANQPQCDGPAPKSTSDGQRRGGRDRRVLLFPLLLAGRARRRAFRTR